MKINYINWSTDIFDGFYESKLYNADTIYNINESRDDDEPEYDFEDGGFEKYCDDVSRQCVDALFDNLDQSQNQIIKSMKFVKLHSPKYYNFETDKIECELDIDWDALIDYIKSVREKFDEYLHENFTSYDGFVSFVPNNAAEFFINLDDDFERLSQVVIEFYILNRLDHDTYWDACAEIATNTIWHYIEPVKSENESETN